MSGVPRNSVAQVPIVDDQPLAADPTLDVMLSDLAAWPKCNTFPVPDFTAIAANPNAFHGKTFHLTTGPATRVATRAFDIKHLSAWQTTSPTISEPILLLIYEPDGSVATSDHVDSIDLPVSFYKTAMATMHLSGALTNKMTSQTSHPPQRILIFVGALPTFTIATTSNSLAWGNLVAALLVGGVLLLIVRRYALKRSARRPSVVAGDTPREAWNDANLPEEPAEALAELRRRSDDTMTHE